VARKRSGSFKAVWGSLVWRQLGSRKAGEGRSTASRRRRQAAVVGNGAPTGIRWRLEAGEHEQALGKLSRGLMGAMGGQRRLPTVASSSQEGRSRQRRRSGLGVHTARGKEMQMVKYELLVSLSRRGREIKQAHTWNTAAARWRPAEARDVVARAKQDSRGRARAATDVEATRGEGGSRRWSGGGSSAVARGGALHRRQRRQGGRGVPEEEERREGSEGLMCKTKRI
jgi:hypothetical protein